MINSIAIIGSGNIAKFHIEAFAKVGLEIKGICATDFSKSAKILSDLYSIPYYESVDSLLSKKVFDSLLICVSEKSIDSVMHKILHLDLPILIEKPGPSQEYLLDKKVVLKSSKTFIAYNRRFYETVDFIKERYSKFGGFFEFQIVENVVTKNLDSISDALRGNSTHMLNLMQYLITEFSLSSLKVSNSNSIITANIEGSNCELLGRLSIYFNVPANSSIRLVSNEELFELKPIEILSKFNSMLVQEPDSQYKIRRYLPAWNNRDNQHLICDAKFKPGFYEQAKAFKNSEEILDERLCRLIDGFRTMELVEIIINSIALKFRSNH
jgi:predicted dehydrogenase